MNSASIRLSIMLIVLILAGTVNLLANTYVFQPNPVDLGDLDHTTYYTWGINWNLPATEQITSANFAISNLQNYTVDANDKLYIHVLNTVTGSTWSQVNAGSYSYYRITIQGTDLDNSGDQFSGQGISLRTVSGNAPLQQYSEFIPSANWGWLSDGNFGIGLDPDCHWLNNGISLTIVTSPVSQNSQVPEPATLVLLGIGLVGLFTVRKKFQKAS
jgi:hypothetical protein